MAIYLVKFRADSFEDDERSWGMNPLLVESNEIPMFWLGGQNQKSGANPRAFEARSGHCLTYESPFYQVSREQLWAELHEFHGGLHRFFRNEKMRAKYGRPTRHIPSLRVNCLIQAAATLERDGAIALMHEDEDHALMVSRCIEWVREILNAGNYTKHERNMK